MTKLPVYEMVINPDPNSDVEVSYVAFVDKPAIERNFLMFKDQKLTFALDEERRIVSGPAMIADSLIYRKDDQGEYNVFFSKQTISQIAQKFFKKDYHKNLNLFHDPTLSLEGVTIFESFVTDKSRGIQPMKGFEDLPDGTWFISAKVENDAVWSQIKTGGVKGFSVEGIFSYVKKERSQNGTHYDSDHLLKETGLMKKLEELFADFKQTFFGSKKLKFVLKDKTECTADKMEPGGILTIADKPAPEGTHEFFDGSSAVVGTGGMIASVNPAAPVAKLATDYTTKDGVALSIDKLEMGGVVMVNGAPAAPGEYELQNGTKCTVGEGGVIMAITPGMAAPNPAEEYNKRFAAYDTKLQGYESRFTSYETKFTEQAGIIEGLKGVVGKQEQMLTQLFGIVEKMAAIPAADALAGNNNFVSQKVQDRETRLKEMADNLSKLKKTA